MNEAATTTQAATTASFSVAGPYVLRLTADDGELTSSDDVTIFVAQPAEQMLLPDLTMAE